jgi:2-oxoglutarate dehydrogenase E2 component (dihydrolipoamide succinyltransferase)
MSRYQLLLPKMGESVAEATIIKWLKKPGDRIEADDAVMEIATDKVDSEVPSPVSGTLVEQLCKNDEVVQVGAVIAIIETGGGQTAPPPAPAPQAAPRPQPTPAPQPQQQQQPQTQNIPGMDQLPQRTQQPQSQYNEASFKNAGRFYSPLVKHIASQEGISVSELDQIPGTGMEGRLTKDDLLNYVKTRTVKQPVTPPQQHYQPTAPEPQPVHEQYIAPAPQTVQQPAAPKPQYAQPEAAAQNDEIPGQSQQSTSVPQIKNTAPQKPKQAAISLNAGDEIIEMDRMRKMIAEHMVMSKHVSPHVTSFIEVDVTNMVLWRDKVKTAFEKRENEKITFTPIFVEAVVKAIKDFPMINVSVNGTQIIKRVAINISMATALPNGNLIVPVIKKADQLSLLGLTKSVNDLAKRARNGKLQPDDVKEGTFTITNVGTFGNVMGTPIINQPQVAILAVGAIKKKPAVVETAAGDVIAIRHMMFLSLSYDHRVVDGSLGGAFIRKVADYLEAWDIDRVI